MEFTRMRVQRDALEHKCELFAEEENVRMQANKVSQERMTHLESCCRAQRTQLQTLLNKSTDHERQQREERIEAKQRSIDEPVDAESLPGKLRKLEEQLVKQKAIAEACCSTSHSMKQYAQSAKALADTNVHANAELQQQHSATIRHLSDVSRHRDALQQQVWHLEQELEVIDGGGSPFKGKGEPDLPMSVERLASRKDVATTREKFLMKQLSDIWCIRWECNTRGLDPPAMVIPEPVMTEDEWKHMKSEIRRQAGLRHYAAKPPRQSASEMPPPPPNSAPSLPQGQGWQPDHIPQPPNAAPGAWSAAGIPGPSSVLPWTSEHPAQHMQGHGIPPGYWYDGHQHQMANMTSPPPPPPQEANQREKKEKKEAPVFDMDQIQ